MKTRTVVVTKLARAFLNNNYYYKSRNYCEAYNSTFTQVPALSFHQRHQPQLFNHGILYSERTNLFKSNQREFSTKLDFSLEIAQMDSKHLVAGSTCPPLKDGKLRFYNMRFCPFAQRPLLVALAKKIPLDIINVALVEKPEWLFEKNPDAKVPTIETKQGSLYESLLVSDYLDEVYTNTPLYPKDSFKKAFDKIWIGNISKVTRGFYKTLFAKGDPDRLSEGIGLLKESLELFNNELKRRGTTFYSGNEAPGMLDYMIWPWIERIPLFNNLLPNEIDFNAMIENNLTLERWRQDMKKDPAVEACYIKPEDHALFGKSFFDGAPNYDILAK